MKFILVSPKNRTVYNFRGDLIKLLIAKGYEVIVTGPNYDEVEKIEQLGARFEKIPLNKTGLNFIEDIRYMLRLRKLFNKEKPDITLGYTIKPVIYGTLAAKFAKVKNINVMITGLGYVFTSTSKKAKLLKVFIKQLYKLSLKLSNTIIFQNPDDKDLFVKLRLVHEGKCKIINGSGVNMKKFKVTRLPERLTFFMLARIMYSKGIKEYLEAAKLIKRKYPEIRFILLGALENTQDSMSVEDLQPYIEKEIIEYYGETTDVTKYYSESSVFVLPSYREGTPRTVLEAMAMGRPIITTDAPGCRETVKEAVNGFLIPVKNSNELANKMEWFVLNQGEIERMGKESLKYCFEKYDVDKINNKMLEFIKAK